MADVLPLDVSEVSTLVGDRAGVLPLWATALPLWVGARWLWIQPGPVSAVRYWQGRDRTAVTTAEVAALEHTPLAPAYPVIVLDASAAATLPAHWWPLLAATLAPGGVLFVCGPQQPRLPAQIQAATPALQPAPWHLLELGQEADWHLRPATTAAQTLIDSGLHPPLSLGAWLGQVRRRWLPTGRRLACLPVWRREETA